MTTTHHQMPSVVGTTTTAGGAPRRFDAPFLDGDNTLRVVARHDATAQRRRLDAGFQQGYADGQARGAADVDAAIADHRRQVERLDSVCAAFERATASLRIDDAAETAAVEAGVVELALRIAEAVVQREITDHALVTNTIERALQLQPRHVDTTISVHPADLECAREAQLAGLTRGSAVDEIHPDETVSRGGCVVEAGGARLDAQVDAAFARVCDALGVI